MCKTTCKNYASKTMCNGCIVNYRKNNHEKFIKGSSHVKPATNLIVVTKSNKNTCNLQKTQDAHIKIGIKFDCKQRLKHKRASLIKTIEQNFNKNELYKHEGALHKIK